ncbi:MAG: metallophosphoesterase [Neomegalonema sp.]|nr:metallophosphoesterase [Neomegalonema sp.]
MRIALTEPKPMRIRRDPERPLFAIGDIHGYASALEALQLHLARHIAETYPGQAVDVVYLGDFIDRGPDPMEVLKLVNQGIGMPHVHETALMGNHDYFLVAGAELAGYKASYTDWAMWIANGGPETLRAFGLSYPLSNAAEKLRNVLGRELCEFLSELKLSYRSGDVFCVHAGVDPARALDDQIENDLIWVRDPFLSLAEDAEAPWTIGVTVVHGHTPHAYGAFANRIGCDTGGFATGVFTAVEIWDGNWRFHQAELKV